MTRKNRSAKYTPREPRRYVVRSLRRDPPELTHFCQALLSMARAQREADAQRETDALQTQEEGEPNEQQ